MWRVLGRIGVVRGASSLAANWHERALHNGANYATGGVAVCACCRIDLFIAATAAAQAQAENTPRNAFECMCVCMQFDVRRRTIVGNDDVYFFSLFFFPTFFNVRERFSSSCFVTPNAFFRFLHTAFQNTLLVCFGVCACFPLPLGISSVRHAAILCFFYAKLRFPGLIL